MSNRLLLGAALAVALAAPADAQLAQDFGVTVAPGYRTFSLDESTGAGSISLLLLPAAVYVPIGSRFSLDAYAAYAMGSADIGGETMELKGPVDTQIRGTWAATPWSRLTVGLNVPTGHGTHTDEEAQVAAILSTDLLGFREARFGVGFGVTTGVALAHQLGDWGVGYGLSYRMTGEFEPSEGSSLVYSPGDELVARVALDRNVGVGGKVTLGGTFQHFSEDEIGENNLFEPGARVRGDASYSFRAGSATTMTLFVTDLWRQEGESTFSGAVGAQNVLIAGVGADLGGRLGLTPSADVRVLSHGDGVGSGWIAGAGTGLDLGVGPLDLTPRARVMLGSIEDMTGEGQGLTGFELELIARF